MSSKPTVLVIGAGPAGLAVIKAFKSGKHGATITCVEQTSSPGGQWRYTANTGLDSHGCPIVSSMYAHLWINAPKETIEFDDYTFDEFTGGVPVPSYPPRQFILDYMMARAAKLHLLDAIQYNTSVKFVDFDDDTRMFTVWCEKTELETTTVEQYSHVVVCTSHFTYPNLPTYEGQSTFTGRLLHSHDFRDARQFTGMHVLVVGAHYSAEDIAQQCAKFGSASITISYRTAPMSTAVPKEWRQRPLIRAIDGTVVHFVDGTSMPRVDAIILCTGYRHHYPFLANHLRPLGVANLLWIPQLYKSIVHKAVPQLTFVGATDLLYTFQLFSAQAHYVRDVIVGALAVPANEEAMDADDLPWYSRGKHLTGCGGSRCGFNCTEKFQREYMEHLCTLTDHPDMRLAEVGVIFCAWQDRKFDNVEQYRDPSYTSVHTGTVAPKRNTAWVKQMDDSVKAYIANK